jgi:FlaA1/EpsC-like NDP-sugar epimerase
MELYPSEAVITNVVGTKVVADLAVAYRAECFVMISTDKAVNPSSVMGASKRIAEIYIQSLFTGLKNNPKSSAYPRFITTRFGNVLGSNGSVIPLFAKQISAGGPITVTHPEIIRYFMTIPEACSLVLEAGNLGNGGEVFVFDMGEPMKIKDMAEEMIRLSGLEPYKDINIIFTGLRPGEKLHEELLYDKEAGKQTYNKKIMIGSVREYDYKQVSTWLKNLVQKTSEYNESEIVQIMKEIVPEYVSINSEYEDLDNN